MARRTGCNPFIIKTSPKAHRLYSLWAFGLVMDAGKWYNTPHIERRDDCSGREQETTLRSKTIHEEFYSGWSIHWDDFPSIRIGSKILINAKKLQEWVDNQSAIEV